MNPKNDPMDALQRLRRTRVLAVLRAPSADGAVSAANALVEGGVTGIEVTFSTPDAVRVIAALRRQHGPSLFLGAGTVTTADQARRAADAGASFLVSPGSRRRLTSAMKATGLLVMTGVLTPSEVMAALDYGSDVLKVFPASLGGPAFLSALRGPFPDVPFMPTGGVTADNIGVWLAAGAIAVGAGSDLVSAADIAAERFAEIRRRAAKFAAGGAQE